MFASDHISPCLINLPTPIDELPASNLFVTLLNYTQLVLLVIAYQFPQTNFRTGKNGPLLIGSNNKNLALLNFSKIALLIVYTIHKCSVQMI